MNTGERHDNEEEEIWDEGEVQPTAKAPRAIVAVAFDQVDFELVAEHAKRYDITTSEFIRRAALGSVMPV